MVQRGRIPKGKERDEEGLVGSLSRRLRGWEKMKKCTKIAEKSMGEKVQVVMGGKGRIGSLVFQRAQYPRQT
jgi:hypothetical protein